MYFIQGFQLFQFIPFLLGFPCSLFFQDFLPDFIDIVLLPFFQPGSNLPFQPLFHCAPGQQFRQPVFQLVHHYRHIFRRWGNMIIPAFQNQPLQTKQSFSWIFIMYIFQCIILSGVYNQLFRSYCPCIDPVNGVYLFFQFILPDFLLIPSMKKSIQHITKLFHTRLEISVFH